MIRGIRSSTNCMRQSGIEVVRGEDGETVLDIVIRLSSLRVVSMRCLMHLLFSSSTFACRLPPGVCLHSPLMAYSTSIYFPQNRAHHAFFGFCGIAALLIALASFVVLFPISHPQPLRILTTFGATATVRGTRMKMNDLWMA